MTRSTLTRRTVAPRIRRAVRPRLDPLEGRLLLTAGDLDPTFGTVLTPSTRSGIATTSFCTSPNQFATGVVVQPDGKMVISGTSIDLARLLELGHQVGDGFDAGSVEFRTNLVLLRYNSNGKVDTTFGSNGLARTELPGTGSVVGLQTVNGDTKALVLVGNRLARFNSDGSPDNTFGPGGVDRDDLGPAGNPAALAFQGDKIVVAGAASVPDGLYPARSVFALTRLNADGTRDGSFGNGGSVTLDFTPAAHEVWALPSALAIQGDKIVVAGKIWDLRNARSIEVRNDIALARFTADGHLDNDPATGFGADHSGKLTTTLIPEQVGVNQVDIYGPSLQTASGLVLLPDGSIVVAGTMQRPGPVPYDLTLGDPDFLLVRYSADGILDPSFVTTDLGGGSTDQCLGVSLLPGGKVTVTGYVAGTASHHYAVARYETSGGQLSLDPTFADGQGLLVDAHGTAPLPLALRPDGSFVALVTHDPTGYPEPFLDTATESYLIRYTADGHFDTTFGAGGRLVFNDPGPTVDFAAVVALQPDGKVVVGGMTVSHIIYDSEFRNVYHDLDLARYLPDGELDETFGDVDPATGRPSGRVVTDLGADERISSLVIQPDGTILVAATLVKPFSADSGFLRDADFALLCYTADGHLDNDPATGFGPDHTGKVITDFGYRTTDFAYAVALVDGEIVVAGTTQGGRPDEWPSAVTIGDLALAQLSDKGIPIPFGRVTAPLYSDSGFVTMAITIKGDKVVVGGWVAVDGRPDDGFDIALARFNLDGTPDTNFGDVGDPSTGERTGRETLNTGVDEWAGDIAVLDDGRIVIAGGTSVAGDDYDLVLARLQPDGELDASFGTMVDPATGRRSGWLVAGSPETDEYAARLAVRQGKIVVVGVRSDWNVPNGEQHILARFNDDGSLDSAFGAGGWVATDLFYDHSVPFFLPDGQGLAIQADGKVVAVGKANNVETGLDFAVARYQGGDPTVDPATIAADLQSIILSRQAFPAQGTQVTLQSPTDVQVTAAISAVNGLANVDNTTPITITLDLGGATVTTETPIDAPPGIAVVIRNGTLLGGSPALIVDSGDVVLLGVTALNGTDAPTIVVNGGSLTLRRSVIQESTNFSQAAVLITGGRVDLGTDSDPGQNTINVNGPGELVHSLTSSPVPDIGNTLEINGAPLSSPDLSFTTLSSSALSSVYGQSVTLTATVRAANPADGSPTGSVDFLDTTTGADLGAVPVSSGVAQLTTAALAAGAHAISAHYLGDGSFAFSLDALAQTVSSALLTVTDIQAQPYGAAVALIPTYLGFVLGQDVSTAGIAGAPTLSTTATATSDVGSYPITVGVGTLIAANYSFTAANGTLTINPQIGVSATYTGLHYIATASSTTSAANVTLSATITDSSGGAGDIRNATVTFVNGTTTIASNLPVSLVNSTNIKTGTASYNWSVDIGTNNSQSFTIGIIVGHDYTRNSSSDNAVVTVSKPQAGSATGGGYLVNTSSAGIVPGDAGANTNFGFEAKNNAKGLQGQTTIIVRYQGHVYQFNATSITSLTFPSGNTADYAGTGTIQDVTNSSNPITLYTGAPLQVTLTDNGEPGTSDTIDITIRTPAGALWYSSDWNGTTTMEQSLGNGNGGGNLQVRPAQEVAGGPAGGATAPAPLTLGEIKPIAAEAIARWAAVGIDPQRLSVLDHVVFQIDDLTGSDLGWARQGVITLDRTADGYGWFIDPTPSDDSDLGPNAVNSPARGHVDLLSVVAHEMGHLLGFGEDDGNGVTGEYLAPGVRHVPVASQTGGGAFGLSTAVLRSGAAPSPVLPGPAGMSNGLMALDASLTGWSPSRDAVTTPAAVAGGSVRGSSPSGLAFPISVATRRAVLQARLVDSVLEGLDRWFMFRG